MSSQQLRITLAGSEYVVEPGTTAGAALASAGSDGTVIAALVNGEPRDLAWPLADALRRAGLVPGDPDRRRRR